jgi:hypothetical protein
MPDQPAPDARQIARKMIAAGLPLVDFAIGDAIYGLYPDLPEDARVALCSEVVDLARRSVVTITLPGEPTAYELKVQDLARETRRTADLMAAIGDAGHRGDTWWATTSHGRHCGLCQALHNATHDPESETDHA